MHTSTAEHARVLLSMLLLGSSSCPVESMRARSTRRFRSSDKPHDAETLVPMIPTAPWRVGAILRRKALMRFSPWRYAPA